PTPTATPAGVPGEPTPWVMRVDYTNSAWQEKVIDANAPNTAWAGGDALMARASTAGGGLVPPEYPTTKMSLLYAVPFTIPPDASVNRALLYLSPLGYGGDPMTLRLRSVTTSWDNPTWLNRDTVNGPLAWEIRGAYGASDVDPVFREVAVGPDVTNLDRLALDVTGAVGVGGNLALKVEPWCTPQPLSGQCTGAVQFGSVSNQSLGDRPYLEIDLVAGPTSPTNTPTPTPTRTPTPVPTSTPTPTATPTGAPTATPGGAPTPTPDPGPLHDGLVLNELCVNPVTTDNIPDGIVDGGDSAVELFNHSEDALDLAGYRLCANNSCLWLEGAIGANGYKVYYEKWDGLSFNEGEQNSVRLEWLGQPPALLVDALSVQGQTADHCWAAVVDASAVWVESWKGTLGRGNE
ncbi:MAG: hypothetical protein KDA37_06785, partial [Planctomycetales bacterium]|nr:hypothetical protein [Planctomycetales bacterium]